MIPLVSVVIPTYNSAHYLQCAVDSVLNQTCTELEVIVINDGSTDNTDEVLRQYKNQIQVIRQENSGVSAARNRGIHEARGKYVAFLDADDRWESTKLACQLESLSSGNMQVKACYSARLNVDTNLAPLGLDRSADFDQTLVGLLTKGNIVGTPSSVIIDRDLLLQCRGFDPGLSLCADWDMWIRVAIHTDFVYLDSPLVHYRIHSSNMSRNVALLETDSIAVLNKSYILPELPAALQTSKYKALARNYMVLAGSYYHAKRYLDVFRCTGLSLTYDPGQIGYLLSYPHRLVARVISKTASVQ